MTKDGTPFVEKIREKTAVIVMNRNRKEMLEECLKYLKESGDWDIFDLYICDSRSDDGSREMLLREMESDATLIYDNDPDLGYSESNNRVMKMCQDYRYIYLVNNDVYVCKHWLSEAIKCAEAHPEAGHIASKQLCANYSIQAAGAFKLRNGQTICAYGGREKDYEPANEVYEVDYAGFGLYKRDTIKKLGYLEERYWPIYFDDDDWGLRVEMAGMKCIYCPKSEIRHMMEHSNREHHQGALNNNLKVFQEKFQTYLENRPLRVRKGACDINAKKGGEIPDEWFEE